MNLRHTVLLLAAALPLAACSAAVHVARPPAAPAPPAPVAAPARQLGIDIDYYANSRDVATTARQEVTYIKSLHANAVSISFPFFSNPAGTTVKATSSTPTTAQLGTVITAAEREGLAVTLRPLLDEKSIGVSSRTNWKPVGLDRWFAAYRRFLLPYAELAQRDHVATFVVGVEFTKFGAVAQWDALLASLDIVYYGTLAYSSNWATPEHSMAGNGGSHVTEMVDAYPPLALPDGAPQSWLDSAWDLWAGPLPRGTVLSEVGIGAESGAYPHPWEWGPVKALDPQIQAGWFTAACHAVTADHLGGLYFWSLGFGQSLTVPAGPAQPDSFVGTPGAAAIAKCFAGLGG